MLEIETGVLWNLTFVVNKIIPHSHKLLGPPGSLAALGSLTAFVTGPERISSIILEALFRR